MSGWYWRLACRRCSIWLAGPNICAQRTDTKSRLQDDGIHDVLGLCPNLVSQATCRAQMSFNEFLRRCEVLDLDVDPKMAQQGRLSARDIQKMKVRRRPTDSHGILCQWLRAC